MDSSILLLGLGGLLREERLGTAQFTLTLPFRRRQWLQVRAALGSIQAAVLALVPVLVIPLAAHVIGHSYPIWEALKFSGLLFAAGLVFFFDAIFWSSLLGGEFSAIAVSGIFRLIRFYGARLPISMDFLLPVSVFQCQRVSWRV
jgi:hypothetical protein